MLKGGTNGFEVVLTLELDVLAILRGGDEKVSTLYKGGGAKCFTLSLVVGGGRKKLWIRDFSIL